MGRLARFAGIGVAALAVVGHGLDAFAAPPAGYELSFADEFDAASLDTSTWRVLPSRPNVTLNGGVAEFLTVQTGTNTYQEGWIDTINFRQRYGYFETRMRIGDKSGLNNAFWLNTPTEWSLANNDHDRLEIDIIEGHYPDPISRDFNCGIHDWEDGSGITYGGGTGIDVGNLSTAFNIIGLEWRTDNTLVFSLNGTVRHTISAATFENTRSTIPLEVILSSKVLFEGFAGTVDPNIAGTKMSIDYVRVYDEPGFIGATSGNWGSGTNWADGDWDRTGEAALFNRATPFTTITIAGVDKLARDIVFDNASVPALTFVPRSDFPNAILRLGLNETAGITINHDVVASQTFNIPIVAEGNLTVSNFAAAADVELILNQPITGVGADRELTAFTTNTVIINGPIASSIDVVQKYQTGTARLAGANEYLGQTLIKQGTLEIASATALGAASAGTIVSSEATLGLSGGFTYLRAESLDIVGDGSGTRTGAIELLDASTVSIESMPITLTGNATVSNPNPAGVLRLGSVTINPTSTLTFVGAGTTEVNGNVNGAGRFVSTGSGRIVIGTATTVAGQVKVINGGTLEIRSSAIEFQSNFDLISSRLDLLDNTLVLDKTADNALPDIRGLVRNGYSAGTWTGAGIITSLSSTGLVIGFADNAVLGLTTFDGVTVDDDSILLKATLPGDANLDGSVGFDDLLSLAQNYGMSARTWTDGDSDYNLVVDFADLLALAQSYGNAASREFDALPDAFQADVALAFSIVPEPTMLCGIGAVLALSRRARHSSSASAS